METMSAVEELDRRFGIPGVARICEGNGGLPRIRITGSRADGEMYLHGAQVTSWKLAGSPGNPRRNPDLLSLVSRQGRRSESARTWVCAHKKLAARVHFRRQI
jgi:hypothetical protein